MSFFFSHYVYYFTIFVIFMGHFSVSVSALSIKWIFCQRHYFFEDEIFTLLMFYARKYVFSGKGKLLQNPIKINPWPNTSSSKEASYFLIVVVDRLKAMTFHSVIFILASKQHLWMFSHFVPIDYPRSCTKSHQISSGDSHSISEMSSKIRLRQLHHQCPGF